MPAVGSADREEGAETTVGKMLLDAAVEEGDVPGNGDT